MSVLRGEHSGPGSMRRVAGSLEYAPAVANGFQAAEKTPPRSIDSRYIGVRYIASLLMEEHAMDGINPELMRGSLDLLVLSVISEGSLYGYLIQQRLRERSGDLVDMKAGKLYPILHRLEADGFVKAEWEQDVARPRKWYSLTAAGKKRLKERISEWQAFVLCVQNVLGASGPPAFQPS